MQSIDAAKMVLRFLLSALRTILRGFGLTFIVLVVLSLGVIGYARHRFGPEEVRRLAVAQLQALLQREVSINRLILTPRGLKIKGLRVKSGRATGDLLVCDSVLLTVKLKPLMKRRLEFDTLRLDSPSISLTRAVEGDWDLLDIFMSTSTTSGGTLPLALAAAETVIVDGTLRLDDRKMGRKISFDKFSLRAEAFDLNSPFPLSVSFVNSISIASRTVVTTLSAQGSINLAGLRWSSATAHADRFSAEIDGVSLGGSASVSDYIHPLVEVEASVSAFGADLWPKWIDRDASLSMPATRVSSRVSSSAPKKIDVERLSVETPAGTAMAEGSFDFSSDTPTLRASASARSVSLDKAVDWHPSWAARGLRGRMSFRVAVEGRLGALQIKEAELSLRDFAATWAQHSVAGMDLDAMAADEFSVLRASVTKGTIVAFNDEFKDLSVSLSVAKQTLTVENLGLLWGQSRLRLRCRVDRLSAPKEVLISGNIDKLEWEDAQRLVRSIVVAYSTSSAAAPREENARPWVRTFKYVIPRGFPDTAGHLRVGEVRQANFWCKDLDLLWSLKGVTPALDKVGGEARMRFGPGRVADIPAVQDANKFLRVIFLPFIYMHKMNKFSVFSTATAYPKTLDFSRIESEYALSKGVAATRYFHVESGELAAFAEGKADFAREEVDMNVLTRLTHYDGVLPEWWVDEAGRPAIGFRVLGDLNKPELEPRFKKIPVDEIESKLKEGRAGGKKRFEAI